MNLEPTPKPVRIRIKSAGEEHSSLKSLRHRFKYSDILPLVKDGRLSRWLDQISEVGCAEELRALEDVDKFGVVRILFGENSVTDEISLLEFFHASKDYTENYLNELKDLSFVEMQKIYQSKGSTPSFVGDIAFLLGEATEEIEEKRKYYKDALNHGVKRAKDVLQSIDLQNRHFSTNSSALPYTGALVSRSSLEVYISRLSYSYWNVRPFPPGREFQGSYYRYYLFFKFAYDIRHASDSELQRVFMREDGALSHWERYKEIEDSYLCVFRALQAFKRIAPDDLYRKEISKMQLPNRLTGKLNRVSKYRSSFDDVIDELCKNYWSYLEVQNKRYHLW